MLTLIIALTLIAVGLYLLARIHSYIRRKQADNVGIFTDDRRQNDWR
jgi:hypothetical protein